MELIVRAKLRKEARNILHHRTLELLARMDRSVPVSLMCPARAGLINFENLNPKSTGRPGA